MTTLINTPVNTNVINTNEVESVKTVGKFYPYDSAIELPEMEKNRIVRCMYRNAEGTKNPKVSEYVYIPDHISDSIVEENLTELMPYIVSYLQSIEDAEIKKNHSAGISLYVDGLSIAKIIDLLEASEAGQRLTKEKIEEWFDEELSSHVGNLFAAKLGIDLNLSGEELAEVENFDKLIKVIQAYKNKFSSLAGGKTVLPKADCESMMRLLEMVEQESGKMTQLGSRFIKRLNKMAQNDDDLLLSL